MTNAPKMLTSRDTRPSYHQAVHHGVPHSAPHSTTIIRAATEDTEEPIHSDKHQKEHQMYMRPPAYQKPIPRSKPEGYGYYHHLTVSPSRHYTNEAVAPGRHHIPPYYREHPPYSRLPAPSNHGPYYQSPPSGNSPSGPRHSVQSVITSSFSVEDGSSGRDRVVPNSEGRHEGSEKALGLSNSGQVDQREPPNFVVAPSHLESPKPAIGRVFSSLSRSFSSGSDYFNMTPPMKRSFFHHVKGNESLTTELPPDFVPPKRSKVDESPLRKEVTIKPRVLRPDDAEDHRRWNEAPEQPVWESRDDQMIEQRDPPAEDFGERGPPSYPWTGSAASGGSDHSPIIYKPSARLAGAPPHLSYPQEHESPSHSFLWSQSPSASWGATMPGPFSPVHERQFWEGPSHSWQRSRDDVDAMREGPDGPYYCREIYHSHKTPSREMDFRQPSHAMPHLSEDVRDRHYVVEGHHSSYHGNAAYSHENDISLDEPREMILLSLPQDKVSLSETLCVVRENVEVFTATQKDVDAPAPGRKHAIVVGQVGLRCIHCRHTTKASDRVKRAVCYPSSIKRIYRTVIDMKLDHFSHCKFVPKTLTDRLEELKAVQTRSTGTTMQYFIKAAKMLGMEDGKNGVVLNPAKKVDTSSPDATRAITNIPRKKPSQTAPNSKYLGESSKPRLIDSKISSGHFAVANSGSFGDSSISSDLIDESDNIKFYEGMAALSLPEDKSALSPLRCFLREQVCAFAATEEDIASRPPTTCQITTGQVGIGCIHCVKQPPKDRSNRAVCFPFSVNRIYQSVADIQRFHFAECKMLPPSVKERYVALQNASTKGSKGLATRQYWVASAKKLGLVDTTKGIRFARDPKEPLQDKSFSLDILAQAAFSVTTTNKKLVVPEDKDKIAEFLYVVMEQLQPCRFTEADRNKRRVRDVGCIGVECKHCAGQADSRKFFWSSVSAVESNFVSVHTHMLECRLIHPDLKEKIAELKKLRKSQTQNLTTGSQKAFFKRVWDRLHKEEVREEDEEERSAQSTTERSIEHMEISSRNSNEDDSPASPEIGDNDVVMKSDECAASNSENMHITEV